MKTIWIVLAALALMVCIPARSATITWTNIAGGNWSNTNNWSPNLLPDSNDVVFITKPGTYTVTLDISPDDLAFDPTIFLGAGGGASGTQTFAMTGQNLTYTNILATTFYVTNGGVLRVSGDSHLYTTVEVNGGLVVGNGSGFVGNLVVTNNGVVDSTNDDLTDVIVANGVFNSYQDNVAEYITGFYLTILNGGIVNQFDMQIASGLINPGGTLNVVTPPLEPTYQGLFVDGFLTNYGTMNFSNSSGTFGYGSGVGGFLNEPGGVVNVTGATALSSGANDDYMSNTFFTNRGALYETAGPGSTLDFVLFDNGQGVITNLSGALTLGTISNFTGTYYAATGTTINFVGPSSLLTPDNLFNLQGNGGFTFTGNLDLTNTIVPRLALISGSLELGPNFQGGSITNLSLDGILFSNTLPVTGALTATNSVIGGNINVSNGGTFTTTNCYLYNGVTVAAGGTYKDEGGIINLDFQGGIEVGPLVVAAGGTADFSGASKMDGAITNSGTLNLNNAQVGLEIGLLNEPGALIDISGETNAITYAPTGLGYYYIVSQYFINRGRVLQDSPDGTNAIALVTVDNTGGTLTNLAGTLNLSPLTNLAGIFDTAAGATTQLSGGASTNYLTLGTPLQVAGAGDTMFTGYLLLPSNNVPGLMLVDGVLELGPSFQGGGITNLAISGTLLTNTLPVRGAFAATNYSVVNGNIIVANGGFFTDSATVEGTVTVQSGGSMVENGLSTISGLTVNGGGTMTLSGGNMGIEGPLTNAGTISISQPAYAGGPFFGISCGGIYNLVGGSISMGDATSLIDFGSPAYPLINQGSIIKSSGTNVCAVEVLYATNSGSIFAESGTIGMFPIVTLPGGSLNVAIGGAAGYGNFEVETNGPPFQTLPTMPLGGAFNAVLTNGYVPANGAVFSVITYPSHTGTFSSLGLPAGVTWETSYGSTNFTLTAGSVAAPYEASINLSGTNLIFNGTGGTPGGGYQILSATNLTIPLANWTFVTSNSLNGSGDFRYTNAISPGKPQLYFILKSP